MSDDKSKHEDAGQRPRQQQEGSVNGDQHEPEPPGAPFIALEDDPSAAGVADEHVP